MTICNSSELLSRIQSQVDSICGLDLTWTQVSGQRYHTSAIKTDGTLWTWGNNGSGRLGDGTATNRSSPGTVSGGGTTWCQVSGGFSHGTAIKTDGTLWTWGCNFNGQLGNGTTVVRCSPGTIVNGGTTWCQVFGGRYSTIAIKTDGTLWTWGGNNSGQLGNGTTVDRCSPGTTWGSYTTWSQISSGEFHVAAIKLDGTLWTWGSSTGGRLGDGTGAGGQGRCSPGTIVGGGTTWCQVSGSISNTAAIKTDGTLWTWGCNSNTQLGDGTAVDRCSPGTVAGGGTTWCQVSSGYCHTVAIKTDGTLWTWGNNVGGQLGDGTAVNRCSPGTIAGGGTNWCQVFGRFCHSAAVKIDGTLWTWGCNSNGQLGNGTILNRCSPGSLPIQTSTPEDFTLLSAAVAKATTNRQVSVASSNELPDLYDDKISNGTIIFVEQNNLPVISNNECWIGLDGRVLRSDAPTRTLFSWGINFFGLLGEGTTVSRCSPGTVAGGGTTWCQISGGRYHSTAIKTDGTLWTWGFNCRGVLGDGTVTSRCSPGTIAAGGTTWCQVSSGGYHTAAIKTDGTIWTWGYNAEGRLGIPSILERCSPGTVAGGGTTWCQVSVYNHSAAIKTDGTIWTWGCGSLGRLGSGVTTNRCSPGTVAGAGTNWCQVSTGPGMTVAIKTDGTLWTWGYNSQGRLGDGTTVNRSSPGTVAGGGTTWCQVSNKFGSRMSAIKTDGTLWTWGRNDCGQLGDGTVTSRCSPGTVAGGGTTWCQVSVGRYQESAIKTDGTLWTWGANISGQLGNGTAVSRCSPGTVAGGGTTWCQVSSGQCNILAIQVQ